MCFKLPAFYLLIGSIISFSSLASQVSVELYDHDYSETPADDLVYQGKRIDKSDALELKKNGVDLANLNPRESRLWSNQKLPSNNQRDLDYPKEKTLLSFKSYKSSPREIFRSTVVDPRGRQFVLTASLDNHTNILRANLLRLLGYDVDTPKYYKSLTLEFDSKEEKEKFIERAGEETLTKRDRWIRKDSDGKTLEVKGFTLEPAQLRNVNIYLPIMSRTRQAERRVFRALLNVYIVTDFPQSANSIAWERGRTFNNTLIFNHPYASDFGQVTLEDMQWAQKKLARLSRKEVEEAMRAAGLPLDLEKLLVEKTISRINHLTKLLLLPNEPQLRVQKNLSAGNVVNGKLVKNDFQEDYVVEFYKEDEESPYRFSELFRLFKTQITYSSLSSLLDMAMNKFTPGLRMEDAIAGIQEQMSDYRKSHPELGGVMPLKAFVQPLASGRGFANRNVVFGQYLGSTAPIQLVDSVGAEVSLGAFANISGVPQNIIPSAGANASYSRTYTHVRAMPDLKTATSQEIKKIFVPRHFKSLGKVIKDEYSCGIPEEPFVEEGDLNGEKIYYVKYDASWEKGKERAIGKRQELVDSGVESAVLLLVIDRDKLCEDEIAQTRKKHLEEFLKQFALNEMFIVNDSVRLGVNVNAPIPLSGLPVPNMSLSLGAESSVALLRSVTVRKTAEGVEVTVQNQRNINKALSEGLNYFVEIFKNSATSTDGNMFSRVYKINLENLGEEETAQALRVLRSLFVDNDREPMTEGHSPIELDHEVRARLNTFRLLFLKNEKLKMNHEVEVVIPNMEGENHTLEQRTRRLFSSMSLKRKGADFYSFVDRALSSLSGFLGLGAGNNDPGKTFMGSSKKTNVITESELTENRSMNPITRVEFVWSGWNKKTKKVNKIFDEVEEIFQNLHEYPLIERSILHGASRLKSYDVKTSIILYPGAIEEIKKLLFRPDELTAMNYLRYLYSSHEWDKYCQRALDFFGERGPHNYHGEEHAYNCVPPGVKDLMNLRKRSLPQDRIELTKTYNEIFRRLFADMDPNKALELIGQKNFFATTRVTGFREYHPEGFLEYISNSVGEYDTDYGTGTFDMIAGQLGISSFELRAMMYTPSM